MNGVDERELTLRARRDLYPELEPFRTGYLKVSAIHEIYFEESGCPNGCPVLFLHGGPGGTSSPKQRRFFDPTYYRIILFDQRGCGRSTPHADLKENTTWHLVADIEALREQLGIEQWLLFGGSWGSTLALSYAEAYPNRVKGLILRGIFLLRKAEIDWFYQDGASRIFPDAWEQYLEPIPLDERGNLVAAYYRQLTHEDPQIQSIAACAWTRWEKNTSHLLVRPEVIEQAEDEPYSIAFARLECHYFVNGGFFTTERQLLDGIDAIRHIPTIIIQGRYDLVCPMQTAWELHRAWPEAEFNIIPTAGHSAFESDILSELLSATDRFRNLA
jgi:proline iminopeptidase